MQSVLRHTDHGKAELVRPLRLMYAHTKLACPDGTWAVESFTTRLIRDDLLTLEHISLEHY